LISHLKEKEINPNRSTIYRELQLLTEKGIITKNTILGVNYFEMPKDHHHHLVCLGCHKIKKVNIGNHLENQEKKLAKKNKFYITNHSLEFYGYCHSCQV
jgi:Fur family ferric uptake transcriptional regulator